MGHIRQVHPKWFTRYIWGTIATIHLAGYMADQQYGIQRTKDPNITWPWWQEIMRRKEKGEIPMDMPGYMLAKFRNENEERWMERRREEFAEALEHLAGQAEAAE